MTVPSEPIAVPALDLKAQYQSIRDEIDQAIRAVVENQYFILGPEVSGLESEVAEYCGVAHGIGVLVRVGRPAAAPAGPSDWVQATR